MVLSKQNPFRYTLCTNCFKYHISRGTFLKSYRILQCCLCEETFSFGHITNDSWKTLSFNVLASRLVHFCFTPLKTLCLHLETICQYLLILTSCSLNNACIYCRHLKKNLPYTSCFKTCFSLLKKMHLYSF